MTDNVQAGNIFLIDDHPAVRKGLTLLLTQEAHTICGEAGNVADTFQQIGGSGAEIALLDLSLGDESGLDLIQDICALDIGVLIYSMHEDADTIQKARDTGALGYVSKREPEELLLLAVTELLAGRPYLSPRIAQAMADSRSFTRPEVLLSEREQQLLGMLGQGDTNPDMAAAFGISGRTIETYFARIITKLNLEGMKDLRRFAIKNHR
ncbi:MAG: response regulator transcription factor [Trichlorobacter sp.]|uniref:response regulator transcription factor n=1 Tax=Trichlorobacter sp. TaxID=2911007 RepID=UPI002565EDA3|nr:response regulator transcription factor [Trichlorobacter sp.]MDK9716484.1 response regulator transcription factor [Trichlorobacter sp.]